MVVVQCCCLARLLSSSSSSSLVFASREIGLSSNPSGLTAALQPPPALLSRLFNNLLSGTLPPEWGSQEGSFLRLQVGLSMHRCRAVGRCAVVGDSVLYRGAAPLPRGGWLVPAVLLLRRCYACSCHTWTL